jgi:hypothetical protein
MMILAVERISPLPTAWLVAAITVSFIVKAVM